MKFGGYDTEALANNDTNNLKLYRTNNLNEWSIIASNFKFGSQNIFNNYFTRNIEINPELNYIYVPDNDYLPIIEELAFMYLFEKIRCDFDRNYCRFAKPCYQVNVNSNDLRI